ncbi:MAG: aminotransferase class IV [Dysgonomonas sp.]
MNEPYFLETIKVVDGKFLNLPYHMERMNATMIAFFNTTMFVELWIGDIPEELRTGVVKCRILYSYRSVKVEYERYQIRKIRSLKLVNVHDLDYSFKYADRTSLNILLQQKGDCDDILIVKDGYITDTSYSNVVFEDAYGLYTPSTCLLAGTKRKQLLEQGVIKQAEIMVGDIRKYNKLHIINAMIDLQDNVKLDIVDLL